MSRRLIVPIAVVVLFTALSAEAQKRRAVRAPAPAPVTGNCHVFGLVEPGLKATYLATAPGGSSNFTVTYISDTPTKTVTTQKVTTPQATSDVETVLDGVVEGNLRGVKHINVKTSTAVPVIGKMTIEVDVDFVPALVAGPTDGWCVGKKWSVPAVTETITTKSPVAPPATQIVTTAASEGEVLAVDETVVVPAGSFQTIKYRGVYVSGSTVQTSITWVSMEHNIVVKQDAYDGAVITTALQLTALQLN